MRTVLLTLALAAVAAAPPRADRPTLVNPACSHCRDEAKRRADLRPDDRVLCWIRGYSDGGAIPLRFFLNPYRVISDSYGVFVYDPDAGYARGFAPSFEFRFHGYRNGVMVMRHADGTLYSCLSGRAFAGPRKGDQLTAVPTLESDWGVWLDRYPDAVAYHMSDRYKATEMPCCDDEGSVRTRLKPDPRLKPDAMVLGVQDGRLSRAYPVEKLAKEGLLHDTLTFPLVVLWDAATRTAAAYYPTAHAPRKFKGPRPDRTGVSPPDEGVALVKGEPRKLTLKRDGGKVVDAETGSTWDVAGRAVAGPLKGWTLEWADGVQVKWFAWAAEYPATSVYGLDATKKPKEIAGRAEFLRLLPKPFATLQAVDVKNGTVKLRLDGEKEAKVWPLEPDAEVKVGGWWGRAEQFTVGQRVWVWLRLDRTKKPTSVVMLADELSEWDLHGRHRKTPAKVTFTDAVIEKAVVAQKAWLTKRWTADGLPGSVAFSHVFSGELDVMLDHESAGWARTLKRGDAVTLTADPPISAVVRDVKPWRERTSVRLVVGELEASDLKPGRRIGLKMTPPKEGAYPPGLGRGKTRDERVEWLLASVYCSCPVRNDVCTGHFYTLASCNPNGCAMPGRVKETVEKLIDAGKTDQEVFDALLERHGPLLRRPHLLP
jgi:hypothetical protein